MQNLMFVQLRVDEIAGAGEGSRYPPWYKVRVRNSLVQEQEGLKFAYGSGVDRHRRIC